MKTIDIHQVDAFTDQLFGGNPAGVVTNADGLTDEQMTKIAREMNLSETAFVLKPLSQAADLKLRFFTPAAAEIDFCGHATIGALYELARLKLYGLGADSDRHGVRVETNAGVLEMSVTSKAGEPRVSFAAPSVDMEPYRLQGQKFADEFGIPAGALLPKGEVLIDRKLNYVYIPTVSLKQLGDLRFDFERIRDHFASENIIVFCFFTEETFKPQAQLHARGLAPLVGVDEDPFTGSMQAGLIRAAAQNGLITDKPQTIIVEQGNFVGRPGFAQITVGAADGRVEITASAVQVFSTTMEVN